MAQVDARIGSRILSVTLFNLHEGGYQLYCFGGCWVKYRGWCDGVAGNEESYGGSEYREETKSFNLGSNISTV